MAANDLRVWAIKGAEERLFEITEEAKAIFASFPELRAQGRRFTSAGDAGALAAGAEPKQAKTGGRRRTMSAEARRRIGDAQRKRWAAKRQQDAEAEALASAAAGPRTGRKRGRAKVK